MVRPHRHVARLIASVVVVLSGAVPVLPAGPAGATGGGLTLGIHVGGTLRTFPCATACRTTFSGVTTPSGMATVTNGVTWIPGLGGWPDPTKRYNATFSMSPGAVNGWADYVEPGTPVCPGKGSAAGRVTVSVAATGVVTSAASPTVIGQVDAIYLSSSFTYDRAGATAAIVAYGWMRVYYHLVDTGAARSFDLLIDGAGGGVFNVDPLQASGACRTPGGAEVDYQVIATVGITTNAAYSTM